jgi:hypothetical protein
MSNTATAILRETYKNPTDLMVRVAEMADAKAAAVHNIDDARTQRVIMLTKRVGHEWTRYATYGTIEAGRKAAQKMAACIGRTHVVLFRADNAASKARVAKLNAELTPAAAVYHMAALDGSVWTLDESFSTLGEARSVARNTVKALGNKTAVKLMECSRTQALANVATLNA